MLKGGGAVHKLISVKRPTHPTGVHMADYLIGWFSNLDEIGPSRLTSTSCICQSAPYTKLDCAWGPCQLLDTTNFTHWFQRDFCGWSTINLWAARMRVTWIWTARLKPTRSSECAWGTAAQFDMFNHQQESQSTNGANSESQMIQRSYPEEGLQYWTFNGCREKKIKT